MVNVILWWQPRLFTLARCRSCGWKDYVLVYLSLLSFSCDKQVFCHSSVYLNLLSFLRLSNEHNVILWWQPRLCTSSVPIYLQYTVHVAWCRSCGWQDSVPERIVIPVAGRTMYLSVLSFLWLAGLCT
jgi:hypothetical protein